MFPRAAAQLCIVRLVRYSPNYVSRKPREGVAADPRAIYTAATGGEALMKLFCLALGNIGAKWTMPVRGWKAAPNRFAIQFEDRMPQH